MQNIKAIVFLFFSHLKKSQLLGTLKAYFKKFPNLSTYDLIDKFLEDEKYYLDIENPHFEFVKDYLNDDRFYNDLKKFFEFCAFEQKQKELIKPYLDKQKELMKIQRKKAQEYKMSKLKPTKKQLFYYDKITKAHNIEKKDTQNASRLDVRNWIMEILEKYE